MKCIVELFGDDRNGRKMIAWGRRIGCAEAGHVFDADRRKVATRLVVDDANPSQKTYLLELVDNPAGVEYMREIVRCAFERGGHFSVACDNVRAH